MLLLRPRDVRLDTVDRLNSLLLTFQLRELGLGKMLSSVLGPLVGVKQSISAVSSLWTEKVEDGDKDAVKNCADAVRPVPA